jgi:hypothetical protein
MHSSVILARATPSNANQHSPKSVELRVHSPLARVPGSAVAREAAQEATETNAPGRRRPVEAAFVSRRAESWTSSE